VTVVVQSQVLAIQNLNFEGRQHGFLIFKFAIY